MLNRFGGSAAAVLTANVVSLLCALVQVPVLTRSLTGAEFAALTAALATGTYASMVLGDPLSLALQRFPGSPGDRSHYAFARRRLVQILGLLFVVGGVLMVVADGARFVVAVAGWGAGLASMRLASVAWLMWQRTWRYAGAVALSTSIRTALLVGLVWTGTDAFVAIALAGGASAIIGFAAGPRVARGVRQLARAPWPKGFGLSLAIGSVGTSVLLNLDRAVVTGVGGDAGTYAAMSTLASITIGALLVSFRTVAYPFVVGTWDAQPGKSERVSHAVLAVSLVASALLLAVLVVIPDRLIDLMVPAPLQVREWLVWLSAGYGLYAFGQHGTWWHSLNVQGPQIRNRTLASAVIASTFIGYAVLRGGGSSLVLAVLLGMGGYAIVLCWGGPLRYVAIATVFGTLLVGGARYLGIPVAWQHATFAQCAVFMAAAGFLLWPEVVWRRRGEGSAP